MRSPRLIPTLALLLTCSASFAQAPGNLTTTYEPASKISSAETSSLPDAPTPGGSRTDARLGQIGGDASGSEDAPTTLKGLPLRFLKDELAIVTSPARIRKIDLLWLLPLAGASAAGFATDTKTMRDVVSHDPTFNSNASTSSDVVRGLFIGAPVALYGGGLLVKNEHASEAGLLVGEAMIDAYVADEAIKYVTLRERPYLNNARGKFFSGDAVSDPSFVSGHSMVVWSSAAVLAAEYPKLWQQIGIYTLATGGSVTRVLGQEHFPTDALLGSAAGWLIGHYVYRAHHSHAK